MDPQKLLTSPKIPVNYPPESVEENILLASRRNLLWFVEGDYARGKDLLIVGGAPSTKSYLEEIREKQNKGAFVMALNGAYEYLQENGIISDCMVMLDSRPINHKLIKNPHGKTLFLIASQCHHKVFEKLQDKVVVLWHADTEVFPSDKVNSIAKLKNIESWQVVAGSQTVGTRALILAALMKFKTIYLYGYDSSYEDGSHHAYSQPQNDTEATVEIEAGGKTYITTPLFARQVFYLQTQRNILKSIGINIILRSEGFIKGADDEVERIKSEMATDQQKEAYKYSQMWESDDYRKFAPGEHCVDDAIKLLSIKLNDKLIDFGCGTGRGAAKFQEMGYSVIGVDIALNCLDKDVRIPLCIGCLWDLPLNLFCDYGYCTDVMEHIPTDRVDLVIMNLSRACRKGCYFQICLTEDHFGILIDDHLHLTVKPVEWWLEILKKYFKIISHKQENNNLIVVTKSLKTHH